MGHRPVADPLTASYLPRCSIIPRRAVCHLLRRSDFCGREPVGCHLRSGLSATSATIRAPAGDGATPTFLGGTVHGRAFYLLWGVPGFCGPGRISRSLLCFHQHPLSHRPCHLQHPLCGPRIRVCTDYHQRSQVQGTGMVVSMLTSRARTRAGWMLFFPDHGKGGREATSIVLQLSPYGRRFSPRQLRVHHRGHFGDPPLHGNGCSVAGWRPGAAWRRYRDSRRRSYQPLSRVVIGLFLRRADRLRLRHRWCRDTAVVYFMHLTASRRRSSPAEAMVLWRRWRPSRARLTRTFDRSTPSASAPAIASMALSRGRDFCFWAGVLRPGTKWIAGGTRCRSR